MPTYIETHAVNTAIGTPTKLTRIGLNFNQIIGAAGEARFALGIVGILLLLVVFRRSFPSGLLLSWTLMLFIMAFRPSWLFIDIPSNRIGTYLSFPIGIVGAIGLAWLINIFRNQKNSLLSFLLLITLFVYSFTLWLYR
jgi:hypothetical protein